MTDAATVTGLAAGYGWIAKKGIKEPMTSDPGSSFMNYLKFTAIIASSVATKQYLEDKQIFPN